MPRVNVGEVELFYVEEGLGPPVVLIMGIGAQLTLWPPAFVNRLIDRGLRVILFDNRDVGLSTWLDDRGVPWVPGLVLRALFGMKIPAPYTLEDLALDTVGLLDALGIHDAHIVGASMGGMVAQTVAIAHPRRTRSLVSIMSNPGGLRWLLGRWRATKVLIGRKVTTPAEAVQRFVDLYRELVSPAEPFDEALYRATAEAAVTRAYHPVALARQLAAVLASGSRARALRSVVAPTLVLHGEHDPLVLPAGGRAVARAVPGATWVSYPNMGHTLPVALQATIADTIADHIWEVERQSAIASGLGGVLRGETPRPAKRTPSRPAGDVPTPDPADG